MFNRDKYTTVIKNYQVTWSVKYHHQWTWMVWYVVSATFVVKAAMTWARCLWSAGDRKPCISLCLTAMYTTYVGVNLNSSASTLMSLNTSRTKLSSASSRYSTVAGSMSTCGLPEPACSSPANLTNGITALYDNTFILIRQLASQLIVLYITSHINTCSCRIFN